jgi:hypothetical protein
MVRLDLGKLLMMRIVMCVTMWSIRKFVRMSEVVCVWVPVSSVFSGGEAVLFF